MELEADHRRHGIENAIRDLKHGVGQPSPLGALRTEPGWQYRSWGLDRAHRPGRGGDDHQDPPAPPLLGRTHHPRARRCTCIGRGKTSSLALWPGCEPCHSLPEGLTAPRASDPSSRLANRLADARRAGPLCLMPLSALLLLPFAAISGCQRLLCPPHSAPHPNPPGSRPCSLLHPLPSLV